MNSSNKNKLTRRKTILTSASTVVLLSAITPVVPVFASENVADSLSPNNFSDVYKSNDHANAIRTLAMNGIAKGYPDYTFAPYQALTMSDALKFLGRYVEKNGDRFSLTPLDNPNFIEDNDILDSETIKYANIMNRFALTNVTVQQLTERPNLSREQTASLLVHFVNTLKLMDAGEYAEKNLEKVTLADLDEANYEYQDAIKTLSYLKITQVDEFKPKEVTTRGQFASFLVRAIENVLENEYFKDDLFADYLFDDVHVAQDGSKIFGAGALPKSTILVKEEQVDFMRGGNMAYATAGILEQTVKEVITLNPEYYTMASWGNVQQAVTNAQQTLLDWEAPEDMLNNAFNELEQAISHLETTESVQTLHYSMATLDVLVMKLLEVQKAGFTEESYEQLQNTILRAIVTTPDEIATIFNELVTATANLQADQATQQQSENSLENASDEAVNVTEQSAQAILLKALEAIVFTVKQYPTERMVTTSQEQLNQSIQFAEETLKQNANVHELTFALTTMIGTLTDIQLIKQESALDELLLVLNAQIQSSGNLDKADYSEDSWQYLENTMNEAKQVLASTNVDEIRATIESVQYAIYQLKTAFYEQSMNEDVAGDVSLPSAKVRIRTTNCCSRHVIKGNTNR